jgi:alpha-D-ribose 1-methylphosphonate 5-triphosphate synthase subunit PhnG
MANPEIKPADAGPNEGRRAAMAMLAAAPAEALKAIWAAWSDKPEFHKVRGPETGLVMVRGRTGGGGAPFNLGEATVTRATVRIASGEIGHAYCLGRDGDKASIAAIFDALWQSDETRAEVETLVIAPLAAAATQADQTRRSETAATKVDFFTMVRGED